MITLVALVVPARATIILIVYTNDGYWLAADGTRSNGDQRMADVCKIHQTRFGLIAKSGESQGINDVGEIYSTDKELEEILAGAPNVKALQNELRRRYKRDVDAELAFLVDDNRTKSDNLETSPMDGPIPVPIIPLLTRTVVMFETAIEDRVGKVLLVQPESDPWKIGYGLHYKYWAPSIFGWRPADDAFLRSVPPDEPVNFPPSVHEFTYLTSYDKSDLWVRQHPKEAILQILGKAHNEQPGTIGPPYSIVHVTVRPGHLPIIHWIAKGKCPGFTEAVTTEHTLIELRDHLRQAKANQFSPHNTLD